MAVAWKSGWQNIKSTGYPKPGKIPEPGNGTISDIDGHENLRDANLRDEIAMSSAEAELYAAADATRAGLHIKMIAEELEITVPQVVQIGVDAQAALGFINNAGSASRMKHLDLRSAWIKLMRDRSRVGYYKVAGLDNPADFFTKILVGHSFKQHQDRLMGRIPISEGSNPRRADDVAMASFTPRCAACQNLPFGACSGGHTWQAECGQCQELQLGPGGMLTAAAALEQMLAALP